MSIVPPWKINKVKFLNELMQSFQALVLGSIAKVPPFRCTDDAKSPARGHSPGIPWRKRSARTTVRIKGEHVIDSNLQGCPWDLTWVCPGAYYSI